MTQNHGLLLLLACSAGHEWLSDRVLRPAAGNTSAGLVPSDPSCPLCPRTYLYAIRVIPYPKKPSRTEIK